MSIFTGNYCELENYSHLTLAKLSLLLIHKVHLKMSAEFYKSKVEITTSFKVATILYIYCSDLKANTENKSETDMILLLWTHLVSCNQI